MPLFEVLTRFCLKRLRKEELQIRIPTEMRTGHLLSKLATLVIPLCFSDTCYLLQTSYLCKLSSVCNVKLPSQLNRYGTSAQ
jgi:hypothetical protein